MNTLESLQEYANGHWATDKTRKTTSTFKQGAFMVTEKRLWLWVLGDKNPTLVKEAWLTGSDKEDYAKVFNASMGR